MLQISKALVGKGTMPPIQTAAGPMAAAPNLGSRPDAAGETRFLEAVRLVGLEHGPEAARAAVEEFANLHAMESGSFLPSNEHPVRYVVRRAREAGGEGILEEAAQELNRLLCASPVPR